MESPKTFLASAIVAAALLAFAAGASATTITTPTGTAGTPTFEALTENGHVTLDNKIAKIECASIVGGAVEVHGAGVTASGRISTSHWSNCTNGWHVTTVVPGRLEVHWTAAYNALLTSTETRVDATKFGVTCVYETGSTPIGTVTGGSPATLHIEALIPLNTVESSVLCGPNPAKWEGNYVTASALYIDK